MCHRMVAALQTVPSSQGSIEKECCNDSSKIPLMKCGHLRVAELQVAEMEILGRVQEVAFPGLKCIFSKRMS